MEEVAAFDEGRGHRVFSARCFNRAWELMEKEGRTTAENEEMLAAAFGSLWHWMHRTDKTEQNLSVGYWQVARVCAVLGRGEEAVRYGELSLRHSVGAADFYLGYAHEAIARGAKLLGKLEMVREHVRVGLEMAGRVEDVEERATLEADLRSLESSATNLM